MYTDDLIKVFENTLFGYIIPIIINFKISHYFRKLIKTTFNPNTCSIKKDYNLKKS